MGQYLSIGIVTNFRVSKDEFLNVRITREEFDVMIAQQQGYKLDLFDVTETEKSFRYSIKEGVLKENLLPLLKQVYPILYRNPAEYEMVVGKLVNMSDEQIIKYADGKPEECFQRDSCAESDYIRYKNNHIEVNYGDLIMLALEGKIIMESYGQIFSFVKQCMVRAFPDQPLASCLRIYITG